MGLLESGMDRDPNVEVFECARFSLEKKYATRETTFHHGPEFISKILHADATCLPGVYSIAVLYAFCA
jgi:hypothetical protein